MQNRTDQNFLTWIDRKDQYLDELDELNKQQFLDRVRYDLPDVVEGWGRAIDRLELAESGKLPPGVEVWDKFCTAFVLQMTKPQRIAFWGPHIPKPPEVEQAMAGLLTAPEKHGRQFLNWCENNEPDFSKGWLGGYEF